MGTTEVGPPTFAAAYQMAEHLARLEAVVEACLPSNTNNQNKANNTTTTAHIIKVFFCQQMYKCLYLTTCRRTETVADIGRTSVTTTSLTAAPRTTGITTPTKETKITMQ